MHDPMTAAHEIKYPWYKDKPWPKKYRSLALRDGNRIAFKQLPEPSRNGRSEMWPEGYRESFITIWHVDPERDGSDDFARCILTDKRPWWKHPKWHFWHWKIQIHPVQTFKRWAFSRCCKCGGRFAWGYSPVTNNWDSKGPRWFRGETDVYHSECNHPADDRPKVALAPVQTDAHFS